MRFRALCGWAKGWGERAISDAAMERAISALQICARKMQRRGVSRAHNVATAACRQAANGAAFAAKVLRKQALS